MRSNRHRAWKLAIASAVVVMAAAVLIPVAAIAAPASKSQDPNVTPGTVYRGTTQTFSISITNRSTSGNITAQGIRVYVDTAIAYGDIQLPVVAPAPGVLTDPTVTLQSANPYIEILSANVTRNQTYTFTMTAKIPCAEDATSYSWVTDVRQSNDFSGTGNLIPASSVPVTTVASGGCHLAFTTQPTNAVPGGTITGSAFNQSGPAVTVQAQSANGAAVAGFVGSVTLASTPASTLTGGGPVTATSSSASFSDLAIAEAGTYTLTATTDATGFASATSNSFTVDYGVTTTCTAGDTKTCSTGTIPGPTDGTTGSVTVNDNDGLTADLAAKFSGADIDCSGTGYVEFGDSLRVDVTNITQGSTGGLTKTLSLTKPIPNGRPHVANTDEWRYQLCFQSQENFKAIPNYGTAQENYDALLQALSNGVFTEDAEVVTDSGQWVLAPATPPAGYVEYRGLLPKCTLVSNAAPCLNSVTFGPAATDAPNGTVTFVATLKVADPMTR